jgi:hypothetical protein
MTLHRNMGRHQQEHKAKKECSGGNKGRLLPVHYVAVVKQLEVWYNK